MRNFRARTDAKAWTLRERHDPAKPSSSAYLAMYGWVRGTVARGLLHRICPLLMLWTAPHRHGSAMDVECALDGGQFQAAVLTGCWACRSSYCAGLR